MPLANRPSSSRSRRRRTSLGRTGIAGPNDDRRDDQPELVDQAGTDRLRREFRAADAEVAVGLGLHPANRLGIEVRSIRVRSLATASSVFEYTTLSAARHIS